MEWVSELSWLWNAATDEQCLPFGDQFVERASTHFAVNWCCLIGLSGVVVRLADWRHPPHVRRTPVQWEQSGADGAAAGVFFGCAPAERSGFSQLLRNVLMRAARLGDCGVRSHLKNVAFSWRWTSLLFRCVKFRQTHGSRVSRKNVPQLRPCVLRAAPSSCWTL